MDTDLSHEALERFEAIEQRLDALEASAPEADNEDVLEDPDGDPEE